MDAKFFAKSKPGELRAELEQALKKSKPQARVKVVLKKVMACVILNRSDAASLMPEIVGLMVIDDYEIRKLCCHYVVHYAEVNPRDAAGAIDFYARFAKDLDPLLRALAIKTLTLVPLENFSAAAFDCIAPLLLDKNPHVRTSAAFSVARLYQYNPKKVVAEALIESLNELLYDENPLVVSHALAALNLITEVSLALSLNINKEHLLELMRHAGSANEWRQVYFLNALMAYVPQLLDDALQVIHEVLPCLLHENSAVLLNAIKVILYLSNYVENLLAALPTLPKRLGSVLVSLLSKPPEIQFLVLRNIILLLLGRKYLVHVDVKSFFWKFDDPVYIKDTKLEIIYLLADEHNLDLVFRELEEYATEVDAKMARKAIRAFGNLSIKSIDAASRCIEIIVDLLVNEIPYIIQEAAVFIKSILRKYPGEFDFILDHLTPHYKCMEESDAKLAFTWMVGQYCERIEEAHTILSYLVSSFSEDPLDVQYVTITAVVKYYVKFPVQGEPLVLDVLKWATEESDNPDLRDRGFFYWRLITHAQNAGLSEADFQKRTKEIVIEVNPLIESSKDNIDPLILEELELNIGTLASIYLKSVKHVFRLAKKKLLAPSPALQEKKDLEYYVNTATNEPIERPPRQDYRYLKPLPVIDRNASTSSFTTNSSQTSDQRKESFGKKLSRRASVLTRKKSLH